MSKKIDESFLKAFAGNMAAYVAGRALASNGDRIKQALGIDSQEFDDVDDEIAAVKQAEEKLQQALEKHLQTFEKAKQVGVAGIVSGGFDYTDMSKILGYSLGVAITGSEEIGPSLIITEGFGKISMAA